MSDKYGAHLRAMAQGCREPAAELQYHDGVRCVEMPCCGFTFDADHTDNGSDSPTYTCPLCHPDPPIRSESTP